MLSASWLAIFGLASRCNYWPITSSCKDRIKRLRNIGNFQGAYYELMIASALIRAGSTDTRG